MKKKLVIVFESILLSGLLLTGCKKEEPYNHEDPTSTSSSKIYEENLEVIESFTPYEIINSDEWSVWFSSTSDDGIVGKRTVCYIHLVGKGKVLNLGFPYSLNKGDSSQSTSLYYEDFSNMSREEMVSYGLALAKEKGYDIESLPDARVIIHTDDSGNEFWYEEILVSNYDEIYSSSIGGYTVNIKGSSESSPIFDTYFDGFIADRESKNVSELWLTKCGEGKEEIFVTPDTLDTEGIEIK